jgi:hypothetical protein
MLIVEKRYRNLSKVHCVGILGYVCANFRLPDVVYCSSLFEPFK